MSTLSTTNLKNPSSGSNNIVLAADGSATITTLTGTTITGTSVRGGITSATAVASTSGTSIDFTGIPSWVKRVTVMFNGVSTNGTSVLQLKLGTSGGIDSTGYSGAVTTSVGVNAGSYTKSISTGFDAYYDQTATTTSSGQYILSLLGSNTWCCNWVLGSTVEGRTWNGAGSKTLSGTLDRVRITTANGTDTFDAGSINILMEG